MLVYLVPPAAVTSAERPSGPPPAVYAAGPIIVFLRIEVESPVGAHGECLLKTAAGRETEDG